MLGRGTMLAGLLVAGAGLPYLSSGPATEESQEAQQPAGEQTPDPFAATVDQDGNRYEFAAAQGTAAPLPTPMVPLHEALSLDLTPPWILARWPRVSTGLADLDLQGYRVAWLSGTAPDDLAGSLTYYFDPKQKLKKITFQGSTADPRRLITLVTQRFGFKPQVGSDPSVQVYQVRWNGSATNELRIETAPIVRADAAQSRYRLSLVIAERSSWWGF